MLVPVVQSGSILFLEKKCSITFTASQFLLFPLGPFYRNGCNFFSALFIASSELILLWRIHLIGNYGPRVCGPVRVPSDMDTGGVAAVDLLLFGPVVAAAGEAIMAFNWDFNCVRWSESTEHRTRRCLSAGARPPVV